MALFRYSYSGKQPLSPSAPLNLFHPAGENEVRDLPALVDTGSDVTVIPLRCIIGMGLEQFGEFLISGYDSDATRLPTYYLKLQLRDFNAISLEVVGMERKDAILGRDLLNRYKITLDGPNAKMIVTDE